MREKQITEGIKKLNKSYMDRVLKNPVIRCGVEYEFHPIYAIWGSSSISPDINIGNVAHLEQLIEVLNSNRGYAIRDFDKDYASENDEYIAIGTIDDLLEENFKYDIDSTLVDVVDLMQSIIENFEDIPETPKESIITFIREYATSKSINSNAYISESEKEIQLVINLAHADRNGEYLSKGESIDKLSEYLYDRVMIDLIGIIAEDYTYEEDENGHYDDFTQAVIDFTELLKSFELTTEINYDVLKNLSSEELAQMDNYYFDDIDFTDYSYFTDKFGNYTSLTFVDFDPRDISTHNDETYVETQTIEQELDQIGIDYNEVTTDNNNQIEVITDIMNVEDTLNHIEEMFEFITNNGFTSKHSGLHISISNSNWKRRELNFLKFFTVMKINKALDDFPARTYVNDLFKMFIYSQATYIKIVDAINASNSKSSAISAIMKNLSEPSFWKANFGGKYQSIKISDYELMDGRIELRYFGGEDYEDRYDEVKKGLLEAIFTLEAAYGNAFDNEYKKLFVSIIDKVVSTTSYGYKTEDGEAPSTFNELYTYIKNKKQSGEKDNEG